jgi:hypothetical protein
MNNSIKITDLFGINILSNKGINDNGNRDYVILQFSSEYIDDLLIPINQYNGNYIYKLNKNSNYFTKLNTKKIFNIHDYVELGNYIIYDNNNIKILLIHKSKSSQTNRYVLIDVINNLYVWQPVSINNRFTNFGVVITTDENQPTHLIGTIESEYVKISSPISINNDSLFENEYSLLGSIRNNKKKILSMKILNNNTTNTKENIEHFDNVAQCIDNHSNDNHSIDNHSNDNHSIDNHSNDNNNDVGENYSLDEDMENNYQNLNTYKGKRLVLVESDNPWYINKENVIELKYINNENYFGVRPKYLKGASFKSNTVYNTTSPNLGYGYSYADRKNTIIEKFTDNYKSNADNIIIIMIVIVILLLAYNYYKNKKQK